VIEKMWKAPGIYSVFVEVSELKPSNILAFIKSLPFYRVMYADSNKVLVDRKLEPSLSLFYTDKLKK
jgi:hypothetical protein